MLRSYLDKLPYLIFLLVVGLVAIDRWNLLELFAFQYIDDDQAVLWHAVDDFSKGLFYEPRFYGQSYSSSLEALLATPLYLLGLPLNYSLPIVTSLMSLVPFLLISIVLCKRGLFFAGLAVMSMPLWLTFEYSLITSLPRGFVPGLFFSGIGAFLFLDLVFSKSPSKPLRPVLLGFFSVFAASVNPNSFPVSVLCLAYIGLSQTDRALLVRVGVGLLLGLLLHFGIQSFYYVFPGTVAHPLDPFSWSTGRLAMSSKFMDNFFNDYGFFFLPNYLVVLVLSVSLLALLFFSTDRAKWLSWLLTLAVLFFSLGLEKVHGGSHPLFLPTSRMFLCLPILLAIAGALLAHHSTERIHTRWYCFGILVIASGLFLSRQTRMQESVKALLSVPTKDVEATTVTRMRNKCIMLARLSEEHKAELVVFDEFGLGKILNYACPVVTAGKVKTLFPKLERRSWRIREERLGRRSRILLYNFQNPKKMRDRPATMKITRLMKVPRILYIELKPRSITGFLRKSGFLVRSIKN